jgi:hypothetical protein
MRFRGGKTKVHGRETESSPVYISSILTSPLNRNEILHTVFYKHTHTHTHTPYAVPLLHPRQSDIYSSPFMTHGIGNVLITSGCVGSWQLLSMVLLLKHVLPVR